MAYKIIITASAEKDLDGILQYNLFKLCNPQAARHVLDEVERVYAILAQTPEIFPECAQKLLKVYRKATFMQYLMIFKIADDTVYVERFFSEPEDYAYKL